MPKELAGVESESIQRLTLRAKGTTHFIVILAQAGIHSKKWHNANIMMESLPAQG